MYFTKHYELDTLAVD